MKFVRSTTSIVFITIGALSFAGCTTGDVPNNSADVQLTGTLNGTGATSQSVAQEAWIAGFQTAHQDVTINYDPSGSGAGRQAFIAGGSDFAGSDSPLTEAELAGNFVPCAPNTKAIDLPVYISPIAVVFNVNGVSTLNLDAGTLAQIFAGTITKWNDPAIVALNSGVNLPGTTITAVHRSDNSGTTNNFSEYLHTVAPTEWTANSSDTFPFPSGEGAQGTSGVVNAVRNGVNTIGYVDASRTDNLNSVKLKVGNAFVSPTPEGAALTVQESSQIPGREQNDIALNINRATTNPNAYPLVLVSYVITCETYANTKKVSLLKKYLTYITSQEGQTQAAQVSGSAPLNPATSQQILAIIGTIT